MSRWPSLAAGLSVALALGACSSSGSSKPSTSATSMTTQPTVPPSQRAADIQDGNAIGLSAADFANGHGWQQIAGNRQPSRDRQVLTCLKVPGAASDVAAAINSPTYGKPGKTQHTGIRVSSSVTLKDTDTQAKADLSHLNSSAAHTCLQRVLAADLAANLLKGAAPHVVVTPRVAPTQAGPDAIALTLAISSGQGSGTGSSGAGTVIFFVVGRSIITLTSIGVGVPQLSAGMVAQLIAHMRERATTVASASP